MSATPPDIARRASPFLDQLIERHPGWFEALGQAGRLDADAPPRAADAQSAIRNHGLMAGLRHFRNREMMRIVWRELNKRATLEQTMGDLSCLAEICLDTALAEHEAALSARFGSPRGPDGRAQRLVVLGLGKLGGEELNLSSDIDIVFCFAEPGTTDSARGMANEQFFQRLARAVVKTLSEVTAEGFCFRVDTRLRPFGESGPLVCSFGAMEQYYQREGRDWERYALIKARAVAGDREAGAALLEALSPFVYRRYIDFGAVESLREMLASVRRDAARRGRVDDIKRGPGGIREVEFLVQCLQLLRGGREPGLQTPRLLQALGRLADLDILPGSLAADLERSYRFLRRLENAIQALRDQQVHALPGGEDLERVALVLSEGDPAALRGQLQAVRAGVRGALEACFPEPEGEPQPAGATIPDLLDGESEDGDALSRFRARLGRMALSDRATTRLNRFLPMLLERLAGTSEDVRADVLGLVSGICRRSAYLALLVENPAALDRMVGLFARSDWLARNVTRYPALLDELIDPTLGRALPDGAEMRDAARRVLAGHADPESAIGALNYVKRSFSLRIAVAELVGALPAEQAQACLTELAEALLEACLALAGKMLEPVSPTDPGLAVIAYGTLGAGEMSYGSDLDLIFLHADAGQAGGDETGADSHYTRLTRRMLGLATSLTPSGRLYAIDTRLRPNGRAGLLVSSLTAFARYQGAEAWTWELQALTRARPVAGDAGLGDAFTQIRSQVLAQPRDAAQTQREVREMRARMREQFGAGDPLKHGPGALVDIGFVAQLGVLQEAARHAELLQATGSCAQLEALAHCGWIGVDEARCLQATHRALVRARHARALSREPAGEPPDTGPSQAICARLVG